MIAVNPLKGLRAVDEVAGMVSRLLCGQHIFIPGRYSTFSGGRARLEAEENIFVRLQALVDAPDADAERQAIENALASFVLKRNKVPTPQSQS
jgi:hypothetical protein